MLAPREALAVRVGMVEEVLLLQLLPAPQQVQALGEEVVVVEETQGPRQARALQLRS